MRKTKNKKVNKNIMQILYVLQNGDTDQYKIGITNDLNRRLGEIQTGCPFELKVVKVWTHRQREQIKKYERVLHKYYEKCGCRLRTNGEWFSLHKADIAFLCKPNGVTEQNQAIADILKMM